VTHSRALLHQSGTLALSWGRYGGFYLHRHCICLGWVALTYVPQVEIDALLEAYLIARADEEEAREDWERLKANCRHDRPAWNVGEDRFYCTSCGTRGENGSAVAIGPMVVRGDGYKTGDRWVHESSTEHRIAFQRPARDDEGNWGEFLVVTGCGYHGWIPPDRLGAEGELCEHCFPEAGS
jgi:hypothetical protein